MKAIFLRSRAQAKTIIALAVIFLLLMNYLLIGKISTYMKYMDDNDTLMVNEISNNVVEGGKAKNIVLTTAKKRSKKVRKANTVVSAIRYSSNKPTVTSSSYDSGTGSAVVNYALKFVGLPYVYGGKSLTTGTDCSGFTMLVYRHFGYSIARGARGQMRNGVAVNKSDLKPGDLVFYSEGGAKPTHVAIYIGNGRIVHESTPGRGCVTASLNIMHYVGARRIIKNTTTTTTVAPTTVQTKPTTVSTTKTTTTTTKATTVTTTTKAI